MPTLKGGKSAYSVVQNASFLLFLHFKMAAYEAGYEGNSERSYFVSISYVISFSNYFKTTLRPN